MIVNVLVTLLTVRKGSAAETTCVMIHVRCIEAAGFISRVQLRAWLEFMNALEMGSAISGLAKPSATHITVESLCRQVAFILVVAEFFHVTELLPTLFVVTKTLKWPFTGARFVGSHVR